MAGFEDRHIAAAPAAALVRLGWDANDRFAREAAPTAARGHNLVVISPPSPAYAAPAIAGLLSRPAEDGLALLLVPAPQLAEWGGLAQTLAGTSRRVQVAHGMARALRQLRAGEVDLLIASPDTALALHRRSALKPERLAAVFLAWPESWESDEPLATLMADLPHETQRIIYSATAERATELTERYARRALTVGVPPADTAPTPPPGPVRTASAPWSRRAAVLADLLETLDPTSAIIWAADLSHQEEIARAVSLGRSVSFTSGDAPAADLIVAYDLPTVERLAQLLEAGPVVLLVPPGAEEYVARITTSRRPIQLPGLPDVLAEAAASRRAAIVEVLQRGVAPADVLTLAPLFERYDPSAVAGALYHLWTAPGGAAPHALPVTSRIYVGIGKKDAATPSDIVAALTRELKVERSMIGRIELRETYSLVELPAQDAERIANALNGTTIRRRRVTARLDRGAPPMRPVRRGAPER
ncbi:MAG TPA: DbpA RNA binding domain-containing protein [Gemmatimonadales bacterium]|nr:DbpA RNA binding domain-containing protein [Gemmatimonadales bacterium]